VSQINKVDIMAEEEKKTMTIKIPANKWMFISLGLAVALLVVLVSAFTGLFGTIGMATLSTNSLSANQVGNKVIQYINNNLVQPGTSATLVSVEDLGQVYKVVTSYQGSQIPIYSTKDGTMIFLTAYDTTKTLTTTTTTPTEIPKTDKPTVQLFVMSHCPYGVKAQETLIPVMKLLGNFADIKTRFLYYAMHGKQEIDDNTIEYCIQKEQETKYVDFLSCFVKSENSSECIKIAEIDTAKLNSCIAAVDKQFKITELYNNQSTWLNGLYPLYPVDKELNNQYDVQGSETLIINGIHISPAQYRWDSDKLKEIICSAFNTKPAECS